MIFSFWSLNRFQHSTIQHDTHRPLGGSSVTLSTGSSAVLVATCSNCMELIEAWSEQTWDMVEIRVSLRIPHTSLIFGVPHGNTLQERTGWSLEYRIWKNESLSNKSCEIPVFTGTCWCVRYLSQFWNLTSKATFCSAPLIRCRSLPQFW
jgi:hypothetical protein